MTAFGPVWLGVVIAALITAMVTATGWFVTHARDRAAEERRRRGKTVDLQKALRAEIRAHLLLIEETARREGDAEARLTRLKEAFEADPNFKPVVTRTRHDAVFTAFISQIDLLPTAAVEPVVAYYSRLSTFDAMTRDLREGPLSDLPPERLFRAHRALIGLERRVRELGEEAVAALDAGVASLSSNS